jgi:hypothetical protein
MSLFAWCVRVRVLLPLSLPRPQLLTLVWICVRHRIQLNNIIHPLCSVLFCSVILSRSHPPHPRRRRRRISHSSTLLTTTTTSLTTFHCPCTVVPISIQHVHSLSECRPRLATCSFALAPWLTYRSRVAIPLLSRQPRTLSCHCHSYLTITSHSPQSPPKHRSTLFTPVNRSPFNL